jgi:ABC-2 type transport system ATP-binding protein
MYFTRHRWQPAAVGVGDAVTRDVQGRASSREATDAGSASVVVEGLRVVRGDNEVLRGLSFEVPPGGVTGVLGPSGSGKTTLLRCVLGIQVVSAGTVTVLGHPAGSRPLRSQVGYASQAASVYDDLTVVQNLRYFAAVLGAPGSDVERVVSEVDLGSCAHRIAGRLSGGQRSRVSLAAAMLGTPKLLVLDEPTVGLDPLLREDLWTLFHRLANRGTTLVVSSHVMDEAERCDSLLLLRDGQVLAHESPTAFKRRTGETTMDAAFLHLVRSA